MVDEDRRDRAIRFQSDHVNGSNLIACPELLFYELTNVLSTKCDLSVSAAKEALSVIWDMEIEIYYLGKNDCLRIVHWANKLNISGYDAAYVSLAEKLDIPLVTADAKLERHCAELGFVQLL